MQTSSCILTFYLTMYRSRAQSKHDFYPFAHTQFTVDTRHLRVHPELFILSFSIHIANRTLGSSDTYQDHDFLPRTSRGVRSGLHHSRKAYASAWPDRTHCAARDPRRCYSRRFVQCRPNYTHHLLNVTNLQWCHTANGTKSWTRHGRENLISPM